MAKKYLLLVECVRRQGVITVADDCLATAEREVLRQLEYNGYDINEPNILPAVTVYVREGA